jgi:hypothetical protein
VTTSISNIIPILWRSKTRQLLAEKYDSGKFILLSLDNYNSEELPILKGGYGYLYIPENDAVLFGKPGYRFPLGERYDLFLYFFEEKKVKKVVSDIHIRSGLYYKK